MGSSSSPEEDTREAGDREPTVIGRTRPAGLRIGSYQIEGLLDRGAFGEVYRARDPHLGRLVALKVLRRGDLESQEGIRFRRECQLLARLRHPNLLKIYEACVGQDPPYYAMELVQGRNLRAWLQEEPRPIEEIVGLFLGILDGLAALHDAGIVHRDLKPENVLLDESVVPPRVKIADLGLSGPIGKSHTLTRALGIMGTLGYLSPEQARERPWECRAASDLFSLGIVLYEALTGRLPFTGENTWETVTAILQHDPPPPSSLRPGLPPFLDRLVARALQKDPGQRYQSAAFMRADLERGLAGDEPGPAHMTGDDPAPRPGLAVRRRWTPVLLLGLAAAGYLAFEALASWNRVRKGEEPTASSERRRGPDDRGRMEERPARGRHPVRRSNAPGPIPRPIPDKAALARLLGRLPASRRSHELLRLLAEVPWDRKDRLLAGGRRHQAFLLEVLSGLPGPQRFPLLVVMHRRLDPSLKGMHARAMKQAVLDVRPTYERLISWYRPLAGTPHEAHRYRVAWSLVPHSLRRTSPNRFLARLQVALHWAPEDPRIWLARGECEALLGNLATSRMSLDTGLSLRPGHPELLVARAWNTHRTGQQEEALRLLLAAGRRLAPGPRKKEADALLARCRAILAVTRPILERLRPGPTAADRVLHAADLFGFQRYDRARSVALAALAGEDLSPEQKTTLLNIAILSTSFHGRPEEALAIAALPQAREHRDLRTIMRIRDVHLAVHSLARSSKLAARAGPEARRFPYFHFVRARIEYNQGVYGKPARKRERLEKALLFLQSLDPVVQMNHPTMLRQGFLQPLGRVERIRVLIALGRTEEARQACKQLQSWSIWFPELLEFRDTLEKQQESQSR